MPENQLLKLKNFLKLTMIFLFARLPIFILFSAASFSIGAILSSILCLIFSVSKTVFLILVLISGAFSFLFFILKNGLFLMLNPKIEFSISYDLSQKKIEDYYPPNKPNYTSSTSNSSSSSDSFGSGSSGGGGAGGGY